MQRDAGLQREIKQMREQLARGREIERRGITPLREFRRAPNMAATVRGADESWARAMPPTKASAWSTSV